MGIYDTNREGSVQIKYTGTHPEAGVVFKKAAEKFVEVLQGQVDIGFNEGFDTIRSIALSDFSTLKVRVQQAGDEPLTIMEIETNLPEEVEGRPLDEIVETIRCPQLPLSRPGRRMFSHMLGHDTDGDGGFQTIFNQRDVPVVQTPYEPIPSLDQGSWCSTSPFPGAGEDLKHGRIDLEVPFPFLGRNVTKCYIHQGYIGFESPNVRLAIDNAVQARNAPCTIDAVPLIFVPDIEVFNPGGSFAISAGPADFGGDQCAGILRNKVRLIEGATLVGLDEASTNELLKESKGVSEGVGVTGQGDLRTFAIFNFNEGLSGLNESQILRLEYEVVLLYPSQFCPGAIGFFYGGPDGIRPWSYSGWQACPVIVTPPCKDHYLAPQGCNLAPNPGSANANFFVRSDGGYLIGANRQGAAWIQGDKTTEASNAGARANLNSRSFWIELDGEGVPTGNGLHNSSPDVFINSRSDDLFLG